MVKYENHLGKRYFAITRESSTSVGFKGVMENYGWTVIFLKSIVISPKSNLELECVVSRIIQNSYGACVFLSGNAVDILMANADRTGNTLALMAKLQSIRTICIGPRTKEKLSHYGIDSVIVPETHNTSGLIKCLSRYKNQVHRIVVLRSQLEIVRFCCLFQGWESPWTSINFMIHQQIQLSTMNGSGFFIY